LWEFGTGLSYTTFEYSNLILSSLLVAIGQQLSVSVTVNNTGNRTGKETVMLFTSDLFASLAPDRKRLRRFKKIELAPGKSEIVTFELNTSDLSFINQSNARIVEPGEFRVDVGPLNQTFVLR
jgi:beta-glucosidase